MTPTTEPIAEETETTLVEQGQADLLDPATVTLTEQEAVTEAIAGLRELIEAKYHFCDRWAGMMGERLPAAVKREQAARLRYLAAIKVLQGVNWWQA